MTRRAHDPSRKLIVHGADPKRWATRHGLIPFSHVCECGADRTASLPFVRLDGARGLIAPECDCGTESRPYCVLLPERCGGTR